MKICLVCYKYEIPLDDPCCYPLGFMYVSSMFKKYGHEVKVLNYNLFEYDFIEEIKDQDIIAFTGFESFAKNIIRDAKICTEFGKFTVLGGALATFIPETMKKYINYVHLGEFETGLNIDNIPWPDYEGFGIKEYNKRHKEKFIGVLTSRGCPYSCTFCAQTCKFKERSLDKVFEEIDWYKEKYKINTVVFNDNTLNIKKKRFLEICDYMKKRGLKWSGSIRCNNIDENMIKTAKESNCIYFVVGVESFNQDKLNKMHKCLKVESIIKTLDLLNKYQIKYHGNVLVGFEDESYNDIITEIKNIPLEYNIFPCIVQQFIGTKCGGKRLITKEEEMFLTEAFNNFYNANGMYQYPLTEVA